MFLEEPRPRRLVLLFEILVSMWLALGALACGPLRRQATRLRAVRRTGPPPGPPPGPLGPRQGARAET